MNNFYLIRNSNDEDKDQYLNYTKKILNKINNQFPMLKINNIINEFKNKTNYRLDLSKKSKTTRKKLMFNTFYETKSSTERNDIKKASKTLRINQNKNFFSQKNVNLNEENKTSEIKLFKKFEGDKNKDLHLKEKEKEKPIMKEMNKTNYFKKDLNKKYKNNNINKENKKNKTDMNKSSKNNLKKKYFQFNALTERSPKRNSNIKIINKLIGLGIIVNYVLTNRKEKK